MGINRDLVAASATPLILSVLLRQTSYGYDIIRRVRELSGTELEWSEGMVYPALRRLEQQGLLEGRWGESETRRRRRYYSITEDGKRALEEERAAWLSVHSMLDHLWRGHEWPA